MNLKEKTESLFGKDCFAHALFYQHEGALRFELSGEEGTNLQMFMQAYQKAENIFERVFANTETIGVCLTFFGFTPSLLSSLSTFRNFRDTEIVIPKDSCIWYEEDSEDPEVLRYFVLFETNKDLLQRLLWGALATDLAIQPSLGAYAYVFDMKQGVLVHPYDDRGMDIIGPNKELIRSIYQEFNHYLFDYDRPTMEQYYGKL